MRKEGRARAQISCWKKFIIRAKAQARLSSSVSVAKVRGVSVSDFFLASSPQLLHVARLIFRIALGVCFIVHGLGKLGIVGPGNMAGFVSWLRALGVPAPALQARLAMLSELIGGALIACGLCTRVAAFFCMLAMIVAAGIGHNGG